jgi:hypothetical protein
VEERGWLTEYEYGCLGSEANLTTSVTFSDEFNHNVSFYSNRDKQTRLLPGVERNDHNGY